jgi:uncharacterized RDD family membrane protein YckC
MSLGVYAGERYLSVRSARDIEIYRLENLGVWNPVDKPLKVAPGRPFKLLTNAPVPMLWVGGGADGLADTLFRFTRDKGFVPQSLDATKDAEAAFRAAAYANGTVRVIGYRNGQYTEHSFDQATGALSASMAVTFKSVDGTPGLDSVLVAIITAAMVFSIFASMRQWSKMRDVTPERLAEAGVQLAPLGRRVLAGLIDAVPVLGSVAVYLLRMGPNVTTTDSLSEAIRWGGLLVYIGHTLAAELLTGRSLGKTLFGLKVVALDGTRPTANQILIRNLLRIIDAGLGFLPLALVPFSPLRQRAGDAAAGTLVVTAVEKEKEEEATESNEPPKV